MEHKVTLNNFLNGKVSMQRYIDFVETKLLEQGCQSTGIPDRCLYRGLDNSGNLNGTACAIGLTMPDKQYNSLSEDDKNSDIVGLLLAINKFPSQRKIDFLDDIQSNHDIAGNDPSTFKTIIKAYFKDTRESWNLKPLAKG